MSRGLALVLLLAAFSASVPEARAHTPGAVGAGLVEGFAHPLSGWDHLLAMLAVGVWAAQLGGRAIWAAPAAFLGGLLAGGLLGMGGVALVAVEAGILASLVVVGASIALAVRPPLVVGLLLVALFGLLHGHAHGTELPQTTDPLAFVAGFVSASILLHLLGVGAGVAARRFASPLVPRIGGGAVAAAGIAGFLAG